MSHLWMVRVINWKLRKGGKFNNLILSPMAWVILVLHYAKVSTQKNLENQIQTEINVLVSPKVAWCKIRPPRALGLLPRGHSRPRRELDCPVLPADQMPSMMDRTPVAGSPRPGEETALPLEFPRLIRRRILIEKRKFTGGVQVLP